MEREPTRAVRQSNKLILALIQSASAGGVVKVKNELEIQFVVVPIR